MFVAKPLKWSAGLIYWCTSCEEFHDVPCKVTQEGFCLMHKVPFECCPALLYTPFPFIDTIADPEAAVELVRKFRLPTRSKSPVT